MRVLVAGGAGYIGQATAQALLAAGHKVASADFRVPAYLPDLENFQVDITSRRQVMFALEDFEPDVIVHLADVSDAVTVQEKGVMECAHDADIKMRNLTHPGVWVVYVSSSVAGMNLPYGQMKLHSEFTLQMRMRAGGYVILRPTNVIGGLDPSPYRLVPAMRRAVESGVPMRVCGNALRNYLDLRDAASAIVCAANHLWNNHGPCPPLTLASQGVTFTRDLIRSAEEIWGLSIPRELAPWREGDVKAVIPQETDIARTKEFLGWWAKHSVEDALRSVDLVKF